MDSTDTCYPSSLRLLTVETIRAAGNVTAPHPLLPTSFRSGHGGACGRMKRSLLWTGSNGVGLNRGTPHGNGLCGHRDSGQALIPTTPLKAAELRCDCNTSASTTRARRLSRLDTFLSVFSRSGPARRRQEPAQPKVLDPHPNAGAGLSCGTGWDSRLAVWRNG